MRIYNVRIWEGTWEEIAAYADEFAGKRLRLEVEIDEMETITTKTNAMPSAFQETKIDNSDKQQEGHNE